MAPAVDEEPLEKSLRLRLLFPLPWCSLFFDVEDEDDVTADCGVFASAPEWDDEEAGTESDDEDDDDVLDNAPAAELSCNTQKCKQLEQSTLVHEYFH